MLIAIGRAQAMPGRRGELVAAAREVVACSRGDDGCESYGFYSDIDDVDTIVSIEIWRDQAALDAHMAHQHTADFLCQVTGLIAGTPEMVFHHVSDID